MRIDPCEVLRHVGGAMLPPLTEIPRLIDAGTTVSYTRTYADFPATAGWALTLYLGGVSVASALAVASGDSFAVTLDASATAALAPGTYTYLERVAKGAEKHDVARGTVVVRADVAQATPGSLQTWEERTLTVLEASIAGQLTEAIASYQIHGRAVSRIPMEEQVRLRNQLRTAVNQQKSGKFSTPVPVRFSPVGGAPRWPGLWRT